VYKAFVGKPNRKSPLGRPRSRWKNRMKSDLKEIGWGGRCGMDLPGLG
jgi:hypothetical protein